MAVWQQHIARKLERDDHYVNHRTLVTFPNERQFKEDPESLSGPVKSYNVKDLEAQKK